MLHINASLHTELNNSLWKQLRVALPLFITSKVLLTLSRTVITGHLKQLKCNLTWESNCRQALLWLLHTLAVMICPRVDEEVENRIILLAK